MGQGYIDVPMTSRQKATVLQQVGQAARDVVGGLRSSAATTVYEGGDLIRRGWNALVPAPMEAERIIHQPDVQAAMTTPNSTAGTVGRFVGDAAQYAIPATRVSRAMRGAPLVQRAMAEGLATGSVAAAQSGGDFEDVALATLGGVVLPFAGAAARGARDTAARAAAGAREGGFGGAVASAVRTVAPGEPRTLLIQALKPRSVKANFPHSLDRALPELKAAEQTIGRPIANVDTLLEATKAAKQNIQRQLNVVRGTAQGLEIDGSAVADAMQRSVPKKLALENPDAANRLVEAANVYRRRFSLDDMETFLRETNAELDGFYSMYPGAQRKALAANPQVASLDAQARAIRQAIDDGLNRIADGGGDAARELRRRYGALLDVEGEAFRRMNVAARQQPESLSEQIGIVRAAADTARGAWKLAHGNLAGAADIAAAQAGRAAGKFAKEQQTTDALIRRAFEGYTRRPAPVQMPARRPVRGYLESGPIVTPPPADASYVRSVPAMVAQSERLALPPGRPPIVTPPAADTSFVRGVPADVVRREVRGALPPASRPMPAPQTSGGGGVRARSVVMRDPRTGRMRRIYLSGAE